MFFITVMGDDMMIDMGSEIFLQVPDNLKKVVLHAGKVVDHDEEFYTADFGFDLEDGQEKVIPVQPEQEVLIFSEIRGEFMKHSARITEILQSEPAPVIRYESTSQLVSAENRQCYRASTVISDMFIKFGPEERCPLLDVSASGFAVMSEKSYNVGETVDVVIEFDGKQYTGSGSIQSIDYREPGQVRYGLLGMGSKSGDNLVKGLAHITMSIQRQQLRRLAGAV